MSNNNRFCNECKMCCHKKQFNSIRSFFINSKNQIIKCWRPIFHLLTFIGLTYYVCSNWETCIAMNFFERFDGNNILFLVWIVLIFLIIYNIRIGDKGVFNRYAEDQKELMQEYQNNDMNYWNSQIQQSAAEKTSLEILKKGDGNNEK